MKTDVIRVYSSGAQMEKALDQVEKVAAYKELAPRQALHLRLLAEEMMGMMRSITGEKEGEFWIEDENGEYRLHLRVNTHMDSDKREKLLSVSKSGKNEAARGLMGRIRDMFEQTDLPSLDREWSLMRYVDALSAKVQQNDPAAREAWDELEVSVVAHVANDVKVSIKGRTVELTIIKQLG